jgi:ribosomal protein S11
MNRIAPALVAATLLLAPAVSPAQSLGEVAEKEKEKKDKDKSRKPSKSYTEEDLRGKLGGTMSNPGASATVPGETATSSSAEGGTKDGADAASATEAAPSAAEQEAKQAEWRARKGRIEQEIVRINASINSFQARLADNTVPMYGPGREAVVQNLERAKADLVRATGDLASAEAEGRTNGYR